jgi:hypothetical protein
LDELIVVEDLVHALLEHFGEQDRVGGHAHHFADLRRKTLHRR